MSEVRDYDLGPYFCDNPHHALLHHVLGCEIGRYPRDYYEDGTGQVTRTETGVALEFGVGDGSSTRCIASWMPVYGFDSFQGLPEDWRPGFEKGMFACEPPQIENVRLIPGLFEQTLPAYRWEGMRDIKLVHIDCDLYSSTLTVLRHLPWWQMLRPYGREKPVIVFDEWYGYPGCEQHEQRAWGEFTEENPDLEWEVIGHGIQQWAVRII